jgi:hypothetical protein
LRQGRRKLAYPCLDWSEGRFHLAGGLGAAIASTFMAQGWIQRLPDSRAVTITPAGAALMWRDLGIDRSDLAFMFAASH